MIAVFVFNLKGKEIIFNFKLILSQEKIYNILVVIISCIYDWCYRKMFDLKYFSIDEITFISCPRPLTPERYNSMKITYSSWLSSSPKSSIILFVNKSEFDPTGKFPEELDNLFGKGRITYAGHVRHDLNGIPYIDDWFRQGIKKSKSKYVSFINSDIPISKNWLHRVKQVYAAFDDSWGLCFALGGVD